MNVENKLDKVVNILKESGRGSQSKAEPAMP